MINLIIILVLHAYLLNPLEKSFFHNYFKNISWRPSCNLESRCYGMPSGSTELIVIFCSYFLNKDNNQDKDNNKNKHQKLKIILLLLLIGIVGFLRIYFKRHTLLQVFIGLLFGIFYSALYIHFNFSLLVTIGFILLFMLNPLFKIKELHKIKNIYDTIRNYNYKCKCK